MSYRLLLIAVLSWSLSACVVYAHDGHYRGYYPRYYGGWVYPHYRYRYDGYLYYHPYRYRYPEHHRDFRRDWHQGQRHDWRYERRDDRHQMFRHDERRRWDRQWRGVDRW
ncbi:MAG: hypothetical protein ACRERY_12365 [Pseudomonas sp.]